ncbi:hypothetical protein D6777_04760 [Candidatus Woesearchaeota archaeon]|nr:MAG: hypothetical protein D6777_04760 [Candidatus Woesearchaeota archaeon]
MKSEENKKKKEIDRVDLFLAVFYAFMSGAWLISMLLNFAFKNIILVFVSLTFSVLSGVLSYYFSSRIINKVEENA